MTWFSRNINFTFENISEEETENQTLNLTSQFDVSDIYLFLKYQYGINLAMKRRFSETRICLSLSLKSNYFRNNAKVKILFKKVYIINTRVYRWPSFASMKILLFSGKILNFNQEAKSFILLKWFRSLLNQNWFRWERLVTV